MSNWTQKDLDSLAAALEAHLTANPWSDQHGYLLIDARKRAHVESQHPHTDDRILNELRSMVCSVCRQHRLYECDLPEGWSPNCALIKKNT